MRLIERPDFQVFDYILVQSIHNATFARVLPPTFLEQARDLANWHEYYVFSSPDPKSIGTSTYNVFTASLLSKTLIVDSSRRSDIRAFPHGVHPQDPECVRPFEVRLYRVLVQTFPLVVQRYRCGPDE